MGKQFVLFLLMGAGLSAFWGCAASGSKPEAQDNDWAKMELRGRVRRVVARSSDFPGSWQVQEFTYNDSGYLLQEDYCDAGVDGGEHGSMRYSYDAQGRLVALVFRLDGVAQHRTEFEYDAQGHVLVERVRDTLGGEMNRTEYVYDAAGRRISQTYVGTTVSSRSEYDYDQAGRNVLCRVYSADGILEQRSEYEYDAAGRQVEDRTYDGVGELMRRIANTYDETGCKTQEEYGRGGRHVVRTVYTFDTYGNEVEVQITNADGSAMRYTKSYEYDAQGNWVRSVGIQYDGAAAAPDTFYVEERKIEYYQ